MFEPDTEPIFVCLSLTQSNLYVFEPDTKPTSMTEHDKEPTLVCLSLTQSQLLYV